MKTKEIRFFVTPATVYRNTWLLIPEDFGIQGKRCVIGAICRHVVCLSHKTSNVDCFLC
jgi:hypothetical protein